MKLKFILILLFSIFIIPAFAQTAPGLIRGKGNHNRLGIKETCCLCNS
jgi:hypothetical protein